MRIIFLLFFFPLIILAQVSDSFTDDDFTSNPSWSADTAEFIVNSDKQLQLNAPAVTDTSYLSVANNYFLKTDSTEWQFYVKLDFSPSSSNFGKVYLVSDQQNLKSPLNGYFVQIGGESGTTDGIDLYVQTGASVTKIIDGIAGHGGKDPTSVRIKVIRDVVGMWYLYADTLGGKKYILEGSVTDLTHDTTNFFGVFCKYTSTRSTNFYFDDIYAGQPIVDKTPPKIDTVIAVNNKNVYIDFDEIVEKTSSETVINYSVNNGLNNPAVAVLDSSDFSKVYLTFSESFTDSTTYIVTVNNVSDVENNKTIDETFNFFYTEPFIPGYRDIVINEIMADPTPQIGLPSFEFVELFNKSTKPAVLKNWSFNDALASYTLPDVTILPLGYLIICDVTAEADFSVYGSTAIISSFPSLTNGGETITLLNENGKIIDRVSYDDSWYNDDIKIEGGYTLELINPFLACSNEDNWTASNNVSGGTPGSANSVYSNTPDTKSPEILKVSLVNDSIIKIFFSEYLDSLSAVTTSNYSIDNTIGMPIIAWLDLSDLSIVFLGIEQLKEKTTYTLTVNTITDCAGNGILSDSKISFGLPGIVDSLDIIINEVLFNPRSSGSDFVELYNRSDDILNLKNIRMASRDENLALYTINVISDEDLLILPGEFIALTEDKNNIQDNYIIKNSKAIVEITDLPSYDDGEDYIVILDTLQNIIDEFHYLDDYHFDLIDDKEGISLERIDSERPSNDVTNWNSASSTAGYATPGYENSQFYSSVVTESNISLDPEVFSPDNDGYNDAININYNFDKPGYVANVFVYNGRGIMIKQILKNEYLSAKGTYSWNGIADNGEKAQIGIYIIYFEIFDLEGTINKYKATCVVAGKI